MENSEKYVSDNNKKRRRAHSARPNPCLSLSRHGFAPERPHYTTRRGKAQMQIQETGLSGDSPVLLVLTPAARTSREPY